MILTKKQIKFLRAKCHELKAVILLGQKGLSEEVLVELNNALEHHELVKIKLASEDRVQRQQLIKTICKQSQAQEIQAIGKTLSIYRENREKPVIDLPHK